MKQPTIYDQLKELKSMHFDDRRLINAAFAEIEKLYLTMEVSSRYVQGVDKIYAEAIGKTPILTPEGD